MAPPVRASGTAQPLQDSAAARAAAAVAAIGPAVAARAPLEPWLAALVLALLLSLQPVTTDLMLTALPSLGRDLHAGMASVQLTMSAVLLAFGAAQLVWGPVADRFGRRPVLLAGLTLYAAASLGAALATGVLQVVAWRAVQGAAMSAAVVCARAMVRDLYEPHEGAGVMARAMTGLGFIAIICPVAGGLLVAGFGWRAAPLAMGVVGIALGALIALRLPETARHRHPDATRLKPLLAQLGVTLRHPGFRAWTVLVSCSYGGLFLFLAGGGIVLIDVLRVPPAWAGAVLSTSSVSYITGTLLCRRWLPRLGLAGAVGRAAWFTLAACVLMAAVAITDVRSVWALMGPAWLYALGHGVHQPCGQTGAVGPFPKAAGLASALAGFALALVAFGGGVWLGQALDGTVRPLAAGMSAAAGLTALAAWTLVRRHGEPARPI